jgi:hypothetical protein
MSGPKEGGTGVEETSTPARAEIRKERSTLGRAGKGRKLGRPKRSNNLAEDDEMYFSPLDSSQEIYFIGLLIVLLASIVTRLHKIAEPNHVA